LNPHVVCSVLVKLIFFQLRFFDVYYATCVVIKQSSPFMSGTAAACIIV